MTPIAREWDSGTVTGLLYKDQDSHRRTVHGGTSPPAGDGVGYAPPSSRGLVIWISVFAALMLIKQVTGIAPDDVARWLGLI
ncbi:hypothetical protein [Streptomyces sp. NPDC007905]|uniref:hypothetical protein n=1 Tax=Streptomyces sp. NPDC007905 TaxID=3364788 RepID=UPI0036E0FD73